MGTERELSICYVPIWTSDQSMKVIWAFIWNLATVKEIYLLVLFYWSGFSCIMFICYTSWCCKFFVVVFGAAVVIKVSFVWCVVVVVAQVVINSLQHTHTHLFWKFHRVTKTLFCNAYFLENLFPIFFKLDEMAFFVTQGQGYVVDGIFCHSRPRVCGISHQICVKVFIRSKVYVALYDMKHSSIKVN